NGAGNGMALGGADTDTLSASGTGRTILVGGAGADFLTSGPNGQAIMIGASTIYDDPTVPANIPALDIILAEWASTRNYNQRVNNIRTGTIPGHAGIALNSAAIVDDGIANTLTGPSGGSALNWFIRKTTRDSVTKRNSETLTTY